MMLTDRVNPIIVKDFELFWQKREVKNVKAGGDIRHIRHVSFCLISKLFTKLVYYINSQTI